MNCPHCQRALQGDFKFCPFCGAPTAQKFHCTSCGKEADPNWASCPYCGQKIHGSGALSANQVLHNFTHPKHGHHYGSSSGHRYGGSSGHYYGSSSGHHRRKKGFLGHLFSS